MAGEKNNYDLGQRIYGLNPDKNSKNIQGHLRIIGECYKRDRNAMKKEIGKEISGLERQLSNYEGKDKRELQEYYKKIKPVFLTYVEGFLAAYAVKMPKTTYRLPRIEPISRSCGLIGGSSGRILRSCGMMGGHEGDDILGALPSRKIPRKK